MGKPLEVLAERFAVATNGELGDALYHGVDLLFQRLDLASEPFHFEKVAALSLQGRRHQLRR